MRVFITGASAGLGRALALHYASCGATLGLLARRNAALESFKSATAARCSTYAVDVCSADAVSRAASHFVSAHGAPDIVIANAAVSVGTDSTLSEDVEVFEHVMNVNLNGMVKTFQPFLSAMTAAGQGALVGIASVAGYRGLPGAAAYSASKAAVIAYLESLRVELYYSGLDVITICPGYIATEMTARNPYRMPFIMSAEDAAAKIARIIERKRTFTVFPWQMAFAAKLLRMLPNPVYDRLLARAPRKPRRS